MSSSQEHAAYGSSHNLAGWPLVQPFSHSARWLSAAGSALALLVLAPEPALARSRGIAASSCEGCHGAIAGGSLSMSASPATFAPGQRVELTLSIMGGYANGGAYITAGDVGTLEAIANQGLTLTSSGLVHNQPKPGSNGTVQFRFAWTAPSTPGAVRFDVSALGGNGNRNSSGDNGLGGKFDFVYGCGPKEYFLDGDGDGIGRDDYSVLGCDGSAPLTYSSAKGDCDDYRKTTFPGATELCNTIDDDCDGQVDEDAVPVELWPDADGDGYYDARTEKVGTPKIGCAGLKQWAAEPGDCRPMDATVHAGAKEECNNVDDDCDGDIDERVRPTCGEGWCRRESSGCDVKHCVPGQPVKEECNFLDDDCDGEVDEDSDMCTPGLVCAAGTCVDSGSVTLDPAGTSGSGAGGGVAEGGAAGSKPGAGAAGCALGRGAGPGALAALVLLTMSTLARRRRGQ